MTAGSDQTTAAKDLEGEPFHKCPTNLERLDLARGIGCSDCGVGLGLGDPEDRDDYVSGGVAVEKGWG